MEILRILAAISAILFPLIFLVILQMSAKKGMTLSYLILVILSFFIWGMSGNYIIASSLAGVMKAITIIWILFGAIFLLNILRKIIENVLNIYLKIYLRKFKKKKSILVFNLNQTKIIFNQKKYRFSPFNITSFCLNPIEDPIFKKIIKKDLTGLVIDSHYDLIIIYFALNMCEQNYRGLIIIHLFKKLSLDGQLIIKEPITKNLKLYQIINILESLKIAYDYQLNHHYLLGEYIEITCYKKPL